MKFPVLCVFIACVAVSVYAKPQFGTDPAPTYGQTPTETTADGKPPNWQEKADGYAQKGIEAYQKAAQAWQGPDWQQKFQEFMQEALGKYTEGKEVLAGEAANYIEQAKQWTGAFSG